MKTKNLFIISSMALMVVGLASGCSCSRRKEQHEHVFDRYTPTAEYLRSEATCTEPATYF